MSAKRTEKLVPGDVVRVFGSVVRTVGSVRPASWSPDVFAVEYEEGRTEDWGSGNTSHRGDLWSVLEQCSANRGADPASGCDALTDAADGLCDDHRVAYAAMGEGE